MWSIQFKIERITRKHVLEDSKLYRYISSVQIECTMRINVNNKLQITLELKGVELKLETREAV